MWSFNYPYFAVCRILSIFRCVSITPFGNPVVPLEHWIAAVIFKSLTSGSWKLRDLSRTKLINGVCLCDNGNPKVTISFRNPTWCEISSTLFSAPSEQNIMRGLDILTAWRSSPANSRVTVHDFHDYRHLLHETWKNIMVYIKKKGWSEGKHIFS